MDIKTIGIEKIGLSNRSANALRRANVKTVGEMLTYTEESLSEIRNMGKKSVDEVLLKIEEYRKYESGGGVPDPDVTVAMTLPDMPGLEKAAGAQEVSIRNLLYSTDEQDRILQYVQANDCDVETIGFSVRAKNRLLGNGYQKLSDFIFLTEAELKEIKGMGAGTLQEIQIFIDNYLAKHEMRLKAFCSGDDSVILNEESVKNIILDTFNKIGFDGLSLRELREKSGMPQQVSDEMLKSVLGRLIADGALEYVDYRCYRIYPKFAGYLSECTGVKDRTREILMRRLQGETLEAIATDYDMTRERVRQIVSKNMEKMKGYLRADKGVEWFDEDYYRYFFETYSFDKKDAEEWLGIDKQAFTYMEMTGADKGKKSLDEAQDDYHDLDFGLRLKIKNYMNRNKLFLDGRWVDKTRADLEEYAVRKYCTENVSFGEFVRIYNDFLREEEVPYDEKLYYTDAVIPTRKNRLSEARFLLWKQNEQIRYYDIDGQDFTELLFTLNLDAYENIEYSTWKFMRDYPEIMEKYDIRDQYELHNLLRKTVTDGAYHDFHCERMPMIRFGTFDRDGALLDLMIDRAPVSQTDFAELVHQEYGYDPATVIGSYLGSLAPYYHNGMYTIDHRAMLADNQKALLAELTEDFYYIDEVRKIYAKVVPGADLEEVNPYNLKMMGFSVLSRYVYRNHNSLDDYFRELLTRDDILDISPYRQRFAYVQAFSLAFVNLKNEMEIFEFEPNQIILFRKLAAAGVTREDLKAFCDDAADYVEDGSYFSIQSIKKGGFESELFDLGFSDWFYASLLTSDERFSNTRAFGNILLYKGNKRITIQSFEESLIREYGSIDIYDLMTEMEDTYGCRIPDRSDLIYKVRGTDVVYDKYMDRLYANTGILNRELDSAEGL